jgi:hypothetical protein
MRKTVPLVVITLLAVASLSGARTAATAKSNSKPAGSDQMPLSNTPDRNIILLHPLTARATDMQRIKRWQ